MKGEHMTLDYTALVTCLTTLFYFYTSFEVGKARTRFGTKAPAIIGNPDFERIFRVQTNTLEWLPIFLPSLWLFAIYVNDVAAAGLGVIWIIGRIVFMIGYSRAASQRGPGFLIQGLTAVVLWLGSLGSIVWHLIHA
jgi:glutathione S-transferase